MTIDAVVFDLGGVLVDWDPRHLYRERFGGDDAAMERFLAEVCTPAWNEEQDAGRPFAEAVAALSARFPEQAALIEAFDREWERMLRGEIADAVALLGALRGRVRLYALSNWSAEKFPIARRRFPWLSWFDDLVISGEVGLKKPDPRLFAYAIERFRVEPARTLYVDDAAANVAQAAALGFRAVHFQSAAALSGTLAKLIDLARR